MTTSKKKPILCMNFGPIGDTLIMLALFDDILHLDPESRFVVISTRSVSMIRDLASAYPAVEVWQIPSKPFSLISFIVRVFSRRWTVLVPGSAKGYSFHISLFFLALSYIPGNRTIGFGDIRKQGGWLPFQTKLYVNIKQPILDNYRRMVPAFMPHADMKAVHSRPPQVLLKTVQPAFFNLKPGSYLVIHMFGTRVRLSFPPKRWRIFLGDLARRYPAMSFVLTGAAKDKVLIEEVSSGLPRMEISIDRPILEVAGMIERSALYVGIDTGITHLAAMLRKPSVVIGNNSNPLWWPSYNPNGVILVNLERCSCTGDKNDDCRVYEDGVGYHRCTYDIRAEDVFAAIEAKLPGNGWRK